MLTSAIASGAATSASSAAASTFAKVLLSIVLGNFNPDYSRENRKRMRYIQQKYSLAYDGGHAGEDPCAIIEKIDPQSKLLMDPSGARPLNPFPDERAFEDSLMMNFHPLPGHQGRFVASHAMTCIGAIVDYQNARRRRPWVPGVSNPGKPNDYVNMFLEESKVWLRHQMTLDSLSAEELTKREKYYAKLKNDNYYWCFPPEGETHSIHKVIDFVHEKVKNALEIVRREEMNKSLQTLFKEMNDHTTNIFEFGKHFLCFLLFCSKKMGSNLSTSAGYDGKTIETGKLHFLLEKTTHVVFDTYVKDMEQSQTRIYGQRSILPAESKLIDDKNAQPKRKTGYDISIRGFESSSLMISSTVFLVKIEDPKGHQWVTKRSWSEFEGLHALLAKELQVANNEALSQLVFPAKKGGGLSALTNSAEHNETMAEQLDAYCLQLMTVVNELNNRAQNALAKFLDARYFIVSGADQLQHAESIPNAFLPIKRVFQRQALGRPTASANAPKDAVHVSKEDKLSLQRDEDFVRDHLSEKELDDFRRVWGVEYSLKILDAHAQLQRIATVLGWTLEINHFFISMFGNTVTFSRLPLRDIIATLKELLAKFLITVTDLYQFACQLNADSKYKWHKNLQMAENQLARINFHVEKALGVINVIESDHLDYETQMRRLKDVYARFQPFVNRVGPSLHGITSELGLPAPQFTLSDFSSVQSLQNIAEDKDEEINCELVPAFDPRSIFSRSQSETSTPATEKVNPLQISDGEAKETSPSETKALDPSTALHTGDQLRTEENSTVCIVS